MFRRLFLSLILCLAALAAAAQEQGFTNRSTELKERGEADARTLSTLAENAPVKVLARGGGWAKVDASGQVGWVRVFHLRFPATIETSSSSSGLASLGSALGFNKPTSTRAGLATTGIRGLSKEDLKNASPNPEEVRKLQSYRSDRASAERFARDGKLAATRVDYDEGARR